MIKIPKHLDGFLKTENVLLLRSHCDIDADNCSDYHPCPTCLAMCEIVTVEMRVTEYHDTLGYFLDVEGDVISSKDVENAKKSYKDISFHEKYGGKPKPFSINIDTTKITNKVLANIENKMIHGAFELPDSDLGPINTHKQSKPNIQEIPKGEGVALKKFIWDKKAGVKVTGKKVYSGGTITGSNYEKHTKIAPTPDNQAPPQGYNDLGYWIGKPEAPYTIKEWANEFEGKYPVETYASDGQLITSWVTKKFKKKPIPRIGISHVENVSGKTVYQVSHGGVLTTFQKQHEAEAFHADLLIKQEQNSNGTFEAKTAPIKKPLKLVSASYLKMVEEAAAKKLKKQEVKEVSILDAPTATNPVITHHTVPSKKGKAHFFGELTQEQTKVVKKSIAHNIAAAIKGNNLQSKKKKKDRKK